MGSLAGEQNPFGELLRVDVGSHGNAFAQLPHLRDPHPARIPIPGPPANEEDSGDAIGLAIGAGGIWVLGDALTRICGGSILPAGISRPRSALPFAPTELVAAGAGAVWVTGQLDDSSRGSIRSQNRIVATITVGREPSGVAVGDGSVWVADTIDRHGDENRPAVDRVVATIPVARARGDRGRRGSRVGGR